MTVRNLVTAALFVALITLSTMYFRIIPLPAGYVHLGDTFIILACYFLKPKYAVPACALGSALADLFGFPLYAPATLVIKAVMALIICAAIYKKTTLLREILAVLAAALWMLLGYFLFNGFVYGWSPALASVALDWVQPAVCGVLGVACIEALKRIPALSSRREQ